MRTFSTLKRLVPVIIALGLAGFGPDTAPSANAATIKVALKGLKGKSTYNKNNGYDENIVFDGEIIIHKVKMGDKYILDPKKNSTIQLKVTMPYEYETSTVKITSVEFGDMWALNKIGFEGVDTNETMTYRGLKDPTGNANRTVDMKTGTLSGMIDFKNMMASTKYRYDIIAVTDVTDPMNPKKIEPIPEAYKNGFLADETTFDGASIPKPGDLKITHVPLPAAFWLGASGALALAAIGRRRASA